MSLLSHLVQSGLPMHFYVSIFFSKFQEGSTSGCECPLGFTGDGLNCEGAVILSCSNPIHSHDTVLFVILTELSVQMTTISNDYQM